LNILTGFFSFKNIYQPQKKARTTEVLPAPPFKRKCGRVPCPIKIDQKMGNKNYSLFKKGKRTPQKICQNVKLNDTTIDEEK